MKNILFAIFLLPLFFVVFLIDRAILACLPWMNIMGVKIWMEKGENVAQSMVRILVVGLLWASVEIIASFF